MPLVDTGRVVRYYIDEAASGKTPTEVLDEAATPFNLAITYDLNDLNYNEISGNRGLENTVTATNAIAEGIIDDVSDKVRDALEGIKTITVEIVARIDDFAAGMGRCFAINQRSAGNTRLGFAGNSATAMKVWWEGNSMRTIDPGTVRAVWHVVYDTAQATADDRVKLYKDGVLQSPTIDANPSLDNSFAIDVNTAIVMLNRGLTGNRERSMDGVLFYAAIYSVAMPQADITTNFDILTADDDTPEAGGLSIPVAQHHRRIQGVI